MPATALASSKGLALSTASGRAGAVVAVLRQIW
jgi:hypothetical protein